MNEQGLAADPRCEVCLLLMCGLPGAGKTTLSKKFSATTPPNDSSKREPTILLVQFDDIIPEALNVECQPTLDDDVNKSSNIVKVAFPSWWVGIRALLLALQDRLYNFKLAVTSVTLLYSFAREHIRSADWSYAPVFD